MLDAPYYSNFTRRFQCRIRKTPHCHIFCATQGKLSHIPNENWRDFFDLGQNRINTDHHRRIELGFYCSVRPGSGGIPAGRPDGAALPHRLRSGGSGRSVVYYTALPPPRGDRRRTPYRLTKSRSCANHNSCLLFYFTRSCLTSSSVGVTLMV